MAVSVNLYRCLSGLAWQGDGHRLFIRNRYILGRRHNIYGEENDDQSRDFRPDMLCDHSNKSLAGRQAVTVHARAGYGVMYITVERADRHPRLNDTLVANAGRVYCQLGPPCLCACMNG